MKRATMIVVTIAVLVITLASFGSPQARGQEAQSEVQSTDDTGLPTNLWKRCVRSEMRSNAG